MSEKKADLEMAIATSTRQEAIRSVREDDRSSYGTMTQLQRDVAKIRTCKAIGWSRERSMRELGWGLARFLKAEHEMLDEEIRYWQHTRPEVCFADYKNKIELMVSELGDVMTKMAIAQNNPQVFVSSVKIRGELLNRMIEKGQDMGLIKRAPKQIEFDAKIDMTKSVREIQIQIQAELQKVNELLVDPREVEPTGVQAAILNRLDPERRMLEAKAEKVRKTTRVTEKKPV